MEAAGQIDAADLDAVRAAVAARGLAGCERIVPLDEGRTVTGYSGQTAVTGTLGGKIAPQQMCPFTPEQNVPDPPELQG